MDGKQQDIIVPKNEKLSSSNKPEVFPKQADPSASGIKKNSNKQKTQVYSKPIFKTKKFDLL